MSEQIAASLNRCSLELEGGSGTSGLGGVLATCRLPKVNSFIRQSLNTIISFQYANLLRFSS